MLPGPKDDEAGERRGGGHDSRHSNREQEALFCMKESETYVMSDYGSDAATFVSPFSVYGVTAKGLRKPGKSEGGCRMLF